MCPAMCLSHSSPSKTARCAPLTHPEAETSVEVPSQIKVHLKPMHVPKTQTLLTNPKQPV